MKKLITATILSLAALVASSGERWVAVTDSDDGHRMLVDPESFTSVKSEDGTIFLVAQFRYVANGDLQPKFVFLTETANCAAQGGQLFQREFENGTWVTKNKYYWSLYGKKMYDAGGKALCDILKVRQTEVMKGKVGV